VTIDKKGHAADLVKVLVQGGEHQGSVRLLIEQPHLLCNFGAQCRRLVLRSDLLEEALLGLQHGRVKGERSQL
jgi:hypothetical protein